MIGYSYWKRMLAGKPRGYVRSTPWISAMKKIFPIVIASATLSAGVVIEKVPYGGWPNCYRLSNGTVDLVVTADVGPRIIRYGFVGRQNLFKEFSEMMGKTGEQEWMSRGGHRVWIAPETLSVTYAPDNRPVDVKIHNGILEATEPIEPGTGMQKQLVIQLDPSGTEVRVTARVRNTTPFAAEFALWSPTMLAQGGVGITGFPPRGKHPDVLQPTNPLVMWAYTDLSDPRWRITRKYLVLHQDPKAAAPLKIGLFGRDTWGAYLLGTDLFMKRATADPARQYPDFQSSLEMFTNADILELETMGPVTLVPPQGVAEHVEYWNLYSNVTFSAWTDEGLDRILLPKLGAAK